MQHGILLISAAAAGTLLYTGGDTTTLVLMYSINVFLTFSLSESGMVRYWLRERRRYPDWKRNIVIHVIGLVLCLSILVVNVVEKFRQGGWITLLTTALLIGLCAAIKRHYDGIRTRLRRLDDILEVLPPKRVGPPAPLDPRLPTAALLVGSYGGLGVHQILTLQRLYPGHYQNLIFLSVGVIDAAAMKGIDEVDELQRRTEEGLERYVDLAHRLGFRAGYRMSVAVEAVAEAQKLCLETAREHPRAVFYAGKLVFERERWFQRLLHNETAYQLQRRLQFAGLSAMVLPVRVLAEART
jgi:hypothetical protein